MMKQLHKFFTLSFQLRLLICKAFVLLSLIRIGLWLIPFRHLNTLVQWLITKVKQQRSSNEIAVGDVIWAIERATHYLPGKPKCFARALTTQILLQSYGHSCELRIGVAKSEANGFVAHAWVEQDGQVLIGGDYNLSSLTQLPSIN